MSSTRCSPHIHPGQGLVQDEDLGMGSRAMASSTRWSSPAGGVPMRLWSKASHGPGPRQPSTRSRRWAGTGRNTGQRLMAAAKKSRTLG